MADSFLKIWRSKDLLSQSLDLIDNMFALNKEMFVLAIDYLEKGKNAGEIIKKKDVEVNKFEINIRQKVLEHLSVSPKEDITSSLIMIGVAKDLERIGDFSKNIADITERISSGQEINVFEFRKYKDGITDMFDLARDAFINSDIKKAKKVMDLHGEYSSELNRLVGEVLESGEISRKVLVSILMMRYLKRFSAHLANIASSVVNPFQRIGFAYDGKDPGDL